MRVHHKINHGWSGTDRTDPDWAARVEREAIATTNAAERAYKRAEANLVRAQGRLERLATASAGRVTAKQIATAEALVELRRQELLALHRQMVTSPASSEHRGRKSYRGVPGPSVF